MSSQARQVSRKPSLLRTSTICPVDVTWNVTVPLGPTAAFHVGCVIRGSLYVHGGILQVGSTQPSNQLFRLDLTSTMWVQIRTSGSPTLSHHACVVLENRYMVLIGGWDGKRRTPEIHVYDAQEDQWLKMKQSGFPEGAGLSSHTACKLVNGDIIVVGREGSLRIQKKHGNVYILSGNVLSGEFKYKAYSNEATSRSGHTANIIGNEIYIIGGRSDSLLERASGFKSPDNYRCSILDQLFGIVKEKQTGMSKLPGGRKNHISAVSQKCILLHGGETFDGRSREPVGEMFIISLSSPVTFYRLPVTGFSRAGHVCFVLPEKLLIHGGMSGKSIVHSDICELNISKLEET